MHVDDFLPMIIHLDLGGQSKSSDIRAKVKHGSEFFM